MITTLDNSVSAEMVNLEAPIEVLADLAGESVEVVSERYGSSPESFVISFVNVEAIAKEFGGDYKTWLNLQHSYNLDKAEELAAVSV